MEIDPEPVGTGPIPAENVEMGGFEERRAQVRIVDRFMTRKALAKRGASIILAACCSPLPAASIALSPM
jgi:hypothetical protein